MKYLRLLRIRFKEKLEGEPTPKYLSGIGK